MDYFLLSISISSMVIQNSILNIASKKILKSDADNSLFNLVQFLTSFLIFLVFSIIEGIFSLFTFAMGIIFGLVTLAVYFLRIKILADGKLNIVTLIMTSSLIIPSLWGLFRGEEFNIWKLVLILLLLFFIYLALGKDNKKGGKINVLWLVLTAICFILTGSIGVLQQIHQTSDHGAEAAFFLAAAFFVSTCASAVMTVGNKKTKTVKISWKFILIAALCGITTFAMNYINLYLSGVLPTQLFFPLVNGAALIVTEIIAFICFKERFDLRQIIGIIGGTVALISICIIN